MDVSVVMHMDAYLNSLKELVASPWGNGKRQWYVGGDCKYIFYADTMWQGDIERDDSHWEHLQCMANFLI